MFPSVLAVGARLLSYIEAAHKYNACSLLQTSKTILAICAGASVGVATVHILRIQIQISLFPNNTVIKDEKLTNAYLRKNFR